MKLLLSFLLIIGLAPVAKWQTDLDVAKQNAKLENKLILVNLRVLIGAALVSG